jgi:hypothetical protein
MTTRAARRFGKKIGAEENRGPMPLLPFRNGELRGRSEIE